MGLTERHWFENEDVPENYEWALEDAVYNSRTNKNHDNEIQCYRAIDLPALRDILAVLKEQEVVEPIIMDHIVFGTSRKCSKCNQYLFPAGRYCPHCGRAVKWE